MDTKVILGVERKIDVQVCIEYHEVGAFWSHMNLHVLLRTLTVLFAFSPALSLQGAISMPSPFTSNMVVQRNQPIPLHGQATAGSTLHFQLADQKTDAVVDGQGNWTATLPALPAGGPYTLTIDGDGSFNLKNILVGDVWFASGQSNMEMPMTKNFGSGPGVFNAEPEIAAANHPNIHFFRQKRAFSSTPLADANGTWEVCTPQSIGNCSAVAYYFVQDIESHINIPIGLICSYAGGTPIESWTPADVLSHAPGYDLYFPRWQAALASYPKAKADHDKKVADQNAAIEEAKKNGTAIPPSHYVSPPPGSAERAPGALYNAMIAPFTGLPLTGIIWYQGEDNVLHAQEYRGFFPALITGWRSAWKHDDMPFLFVQLSSFHPRPPEPGPSSWAELRDAQNCALHLPNTGEAVSLDLGDATNIHYVNKKPVGLRLASEARALVYGEKIEGSSPLYDSFTPEGESAIRLNFSHVDAGIKTSDGAPVRGFTMAGDDHKFYQADASVDGLSVVVKSGQVPKPVAVRYGWSDNPDANLISGDNLPVGTFRTDTWDH